MVRLVRFGDWAVSPSSVYAVQFRSRPASQSVSDDLKRTLTPAATWCDFYVDDGTAVTADGSVALPSFTLRDEQAVEAWRRVVARRELLGLVVIGECAVAPDRIVRMTINDRPEVFVGLPNDRFVKMKLSGADAGEVAKLIAPPPADGPTVRVHS